MTTDIFFNMVCTVMIASLFGLVLVFAGFKLFRVVLPIWGFFFGFLLGAQAVQAIFNVGFLTTITSWVVGFIIGLLFAVLAYPFYTFAVAIIAASLGYLAAVGLLLWIGMRFGFLLWLIAFLAAIGLAAVTFIFSLQKWMIIIASAVLGAGLVAGVITFVFKPHAVYLENPVRTMFQVSPLLVILFLVLVVLGIIVQSRTTRREIIEPELATPAKPTMTPVAPASEATHGGAVAGALGAAAGPAPAAVVAGAAGAMAAEEVMKPAAPVEPVAQEPVAPVVPPVEAAPPVMEPVVPPTGPEELDKFKYNLDYIEGIGPVYAGKLKAIGINNPLDLLERGAFPKGREEIADAAGISPVLVLKWVNHVDLFRIKGVGSEYADLLEIAGVDTVVELAHRVPENLYAKMVSVNEEKKLVRQVPTLSQVQAWVEQAKTLPRKINY
jgi:predicted flap endonuclease-1-like 5' DNA nuclease